MQLQHTLLSTLIAAALSGTAAAATLPNYHALAEVAAPGASTSPSSKAGAPAAHKTSQARRQSLVRLALGQKLVNQAEDIQFHAQLDVPSFVWAAPEAAKAHVAALKPERQASEAARQHLAKYAGLYGLNPRTLSGATLGQLHDTGRGPVIARYRQSLNGIEVFQSGLNLLMTRDHRLVSLSGSLSPQVEHELKAQTGGHAQTHFDLPAGAAVAKAYEQLGVSATVESHGETQGKQGYTEHRAAKAGLGDAPDLSARSKPVYFPLRERLVPAYYVEVRGGKNASDYYSFVISAEDGRTLFRKNLTSYEGNNTFAYRVFADTEGEHHPWDGPQGRDGVPHPTGAANAYMPSMKAPALVNLAHGPISTSDPWLSEGKTESTGNNVDAYADLASPDGYTAGKDLRATVNGNAGGVPSFDYTLDPNKAANADETQVKSAVTEMFYLVNWLHDWFYDAGFDEASGNAQLSNYGRGGKEGDPLLAEAQDYSGSNNANMGTPADGESPVMQMFVYYHEGDAQLEVSSPAMGPYQAQGAAFGPKSFDVSGNLADMAPLDGCDTATNAAALAGKIALIDRGTCNFSVKVANAEAAGAIGAIVINNKDAGLPSMGGEGEVKIPSIGLSKADGTTLRAALATNPVTVRLTPAKPSRDSSLDALTIAHEWGHYISNRLIGNAAGLDNNQGNSMGEGWGDFHALLLTVEEADALQLANANWSGAFAMGGYSDQGRTPNDAYYFGIRGFPYTTDMAKNPLSFKHIENGVPRDESDDGSDNAEVHASGTVWATMLWECYASLLRDTVRLPFKDAQKRMKDYLVASYKLTPNSPTYTEARDALLAVAKASDAADYALFVQAFAKRGMGAGAVSPDRYSGDHYGVKESFSTGGAALPEDISLKHADGVRCDSDEVLDPGEISVLNFAVRNTGFTELSEIKVKASSADKLSYPDGPVVVLPKLAPGATGQASLKVRLDEASLAQNLTLNLAASASGIEGDALALSQAEFSEQVAYDLEANSLKDNANLDRLVNGTTLPADAEGLGWQLAANPNVEDVGDRVYFGANAGTNLDAQFVLPDLVVGADDRLKLSWQQAWGFESDSSANYDGGVVEYSLDGITWQDAGANLSPTYNGQLNGGYNKFLEDRSAYTARSADFPALIATSLDLSGKGLAGKTVHVRFRIGNDPGTADIGWLIDNLEVSGVSNLPFQTPVASKKLCHAPVAKAGADRTVRAEGLVVLDGSTSSDEDGGTLNYAWTQTVGEAVVLSDANTAKASFTPRNKAETLGFKLSVSDANGYKSEDEVVLTIEAQPAPTPPVVTPPVTTPATPTSGGGGGGALGWLGLALVTLGLRRRK